jgi:hypothetical protein
MLQDAMLAFTHSLSGPEGIDGDFRQKSVLL